MAKSLLTRLVVKAYVNSCFDKDKTGQIKISPKSVHQLCCPPEAQSNIMCPVC